MKQNANEGLSKMYWYLIVSAIILLVLGAVLWWYDGYLFYHA